MTIATPVFTYPGSKSNLAGWIIGQMPKHTRYVEPFAGTLAVLLAKSRVPEEVVNDLDDNLVNFFRVLRDHPDELIRRCELTPYARSEFEYAIDVVEHIPGLETDEIERARLWWITVAFSINGNRRGLAVQSPRTAVTFLSRMSAVARRLAGVTIEGRPAVTVIMQHDSPETVFYCDPPYLGGTRDPMLYRVEMKAEDLHREFASACQRAKGKVIISGYPSPLYDEELFTSDRGWHRIEKLCPSTLAAASFNENNPEQEAASVIATEVLWANFRMRSQLDLFS